MIEKTESTQVNDGENKKTPCDRVKKIRDRYFETKSSINMEFPYWYSRRWFELDGEIPIVRRAEALKTAFSHITPAVFPSELLVMGKSNYLRGSFPMPWLSESFYMSTEDKMYQDALEAGMVSADTVTKWGKGGGNVTESIGNILSISGKFGMRQDERKILVKLAYLWKDKSVEDIGHKYEQMVPDYDLKEQVMRSVICMFDSGYTIPQGREIMNYYYPLQYGIKGIQNICEEKIREVAGLPNMDRLYFYKAVIIVLEGIQKWMLNYVKELNYLQEIEQDPKQQQEYQEIAERLEWLSENPPRDFIDALQLHWTFHISVLNEDCISGLSPGKLGQVLYPWWKRDMDRGTITREKTMELLECMRMKYTEIDCFASMGVVGGVLSGNTFNNVCLGGLNKDGSDATNELELLILESGITCESPQPTLSIMYDEKTSEELLMKGIECTKTGVGYPAWFSNQTGLSFIQKNFQNEGMTIDEARSYSIGGCLETAPCSWSPLQLDGETHWIPGGSGPSSAVGVHFIAVPKTLELVLFDGVDQRTGERVLPSHGLSLDNYEEIWAVFKKYFSEIVRVVALCNNIQMDAWRKVTPPVINSLLKPDCLDRGMDLGQGGCRYNTTFNIEVCGGINMINSFASIKKNIFVEKNFTLDDLREALKANFGYKQADTIGSYSITDQQKEEKIDNKNLSKIHRFCLDAPKYGNDIPFVDSILLEWEEYFCEMTHAYTSMYDKPMYAIQNSVSTHGPQGAATIASPDGRLSGLTYADGSMSAYPGTDSNGPYALFNSATVWDHSNSQNSQLNMKIHPSAVKGREGSRKFLELIKAYLRKGGFHIQFNVIDSKTLKEAQKHPEKYRDLLIRVAGFTQYWVELGKPIQDEVIARTEYGEVA
jgi:4-hydroxyphenylacetate decarboxylase large subunit